MILSTPSRDVWYITGETPEFIQKDLESWYQKAINSPKTLKDAKPNLAGNLDQSYRVFQSQEYDNFIESTISKFLPEINKNSSQLVYSNSFGEREHWMNIQKNGDYNPVHGHTGTYSYVFWHKVPFNFETENKVNKLRNTSANRNLGDFVFTYVDYETVFETIKQNSPQDMRKYLTILPMNIDNAKENTFCIFPAWLPHSVDPFYSVEEDRVTFSGNYAQSSDLNRKEEVSLV